MFTGLTLGQGEIKRRLPRGQEFELTVMADFDWGRPLQLGESVAVSGACLTVTGLDGSRGFRAYASGETLRRTTLGQTTRVNLERALTLSDRLGGHLVSGHIDGLGRVLTLDRAGASLVYEIEAGIGLMPCIVPNGSITIDGVSLTVNEVRADSFTVNLIPHTAGATTLGTLSPGLQVNLETDLLGKYVHRLLAFGPQPRPAEGMTLEFLARHGFQ